MSAPMSHAGLRSISFCIYRYLRKITSKLEKNILQSYLLKLPYSILPKNKVTSHNNQSLGRTAKRLFVNKLKVENVTSQCRHISTDRNKRYVLGIETSCDDTGAAIVDCSGKVVGEALNSQTSIHIDMGGILPMIARELHRENIDKVIQDAMTDANMSFEDLDAIAVTNRPGMAHSLQVGLERAKSLALQYKKPLLPIHHMEAHAVTIRMIEQVEFPFMVLLASGGHCLLAIAQDIDQFLLLGRNTDDSPGDAFDKTARSLKLKNIKECYGLCGGASIEVMARSGDPLSFTVKPVLTRQRDCNFSFSGIKSMFKQVIVREEKLQEIIGGEVLSNVADICASFQYAVLTHLSQRLRRALLFSQVKELLPSINRTLVLSGGVASNMYIRKGLQDVLDPLDCRLLCPPPQLCTDNGIMIAWNGMERYKRNIGIVYGDDIDNILYCPRCPIGTDISDEVLQANIKVTKRSKQDYKPPEQSTI